jgi:hypothetical protein
MRKHWPARLAALISVPILGIALAAPGAAAAPVSTLPFAHQTQQAGLTKAQAQELQNRVDAYLAKNGGVQIAANRIEYQKAILTLTLPGETFARAIDAPFTAAAPACPFYHVCLFSGPSFSGSWITLYYCNTWAGIPWVGTNGSFDNNQTNGTKMGIDVVGPPSPWFGYPAHWVELKGVRWLNIGAVTAC